MKITQYIFPSLTIALCTLVLSTNVFASTEINYKEDCEAYAVQDDVPTHELAIYIEACISELMDINKEVTEEKVTEELK